MGSHVREDIQTVLEKDPAARGPWEVLLCCPGLHAVWSYRVGHWMWRKRWYLPARLLCHCARAITGIEIHPGATIGRRLFIDHGTGVVIGETAVIGDDVLMYQGAVLGGTSLEKGKRHPTLGSRVVVGTGATVLGPILVGDDARIGAGSVVIRSVPPGCTAVGVPARVVKDTDPPAGQLEHGRIADPVVDVIRGIIADTESLHERLARLERVYGPSTGTTPGKGGACHG